jgi:hypothetical protein
MADLPCAPGADPLAFACPRCGEAVTAPYYGPCPACRDTLRATLGGAGRTVAVEDYVPKVNVTPNAVALKDD